MSGMLRSSSTRSTADRHALDGVEPAHGLFEGQPADDVSDAMTILRIVAESSTTKIRFMIRLRAASVSP